MGALKPWHIAIFVVVLVLLFGAKRLPDAARSLGRSLRIIKAETKGLIDENSDVAEKAEPPYSRTPLQGDVQPPQTGQAQGYQPPPAPQQQYQQPPAQPYVDPVQRTNDR
ncbi:Sec-independent protein translocase subunit TatA [Paractinoplanes globisporus]|uniref:Sec-independent protein translocase protein TatA n=1 Tax=Paractinoplanes globisporus TaxID=113565 RepID=A0ABW6W4C9_9ACTN|nr:Sec-independent protein translocase subunit TatA [Actinoplanes globisporus]